MAKEFEMSTIDLVEKFFVFYTQEKNEIRVYHVMMNSDLKTIQSNYLNFNSQKEGIKEKKSFGVYK